MNSINPMYINPALVMMFFSMLTVCILIGGVLWKLATLINDIKREVAVIIERLNGHIENCGSKKTQS